MTFPATHRVHAAAGLTAAQREADSRRAVMQRRTSLTGHCLVAVLALSTARAAHANSPGFTTFESGQVRPLALSPNGARLFAVNTPDNHLEVFDVGPGGITPIASVPVGLEPVAVATRSDTEVWVVNHLSDSVSIIDLSASPARVTRTLLVGDEPRDIVFAGPGNRRAFITAAHRGQNRPGDPQLGTPGVGRADVWVFDATQTGTSFAGDPLTIITLFGDTPRALAASADGTTVYAAVFHSGNQTTTINEAVVCDGGEHAACKVDGVLLPGGLPAPTTNVEGVAQPEVGLIVKFNPATRAWEDELGRDWRGAVRFDLPDVDVFAIDAASTPPRETAAFAGVGTVLFNMAINPVNGQLYVSNTEAQNQTRFVPNLRGRLHEPRITVIDRSRGTVTPQRLNPHIDYTVVPSPAGVKERSLATPTGLAVSRDGATLYVAAFGSGVIAEMNTADLEDGTFVPDGADHIAVTGGGPSGVVLDEARHRLYVLTRFDDGVSVIDLATRREMEHLRLYNPEPAAVTRGRPLLYDARYTSSNGAGSCASCHVFGDVDSLAWDLGDPDAPVQRSSFGNFHPLKGPMATQTLRGLATHGPMHWRADRFDPDDPQNARGALRTFNQAFVSLLGRDAPLRDDEMDALADFILAILPPPNPIRALDNSLTADEQAGRDIFFHAAISCENCHTIDPAAGLYATSAHIAFSGETQLFKVPQLRTLYQKVGMFGLASTPSYGSADTSAMGPQIRGFGFSHDGSVDTLARFVRSSIFQLHDPEVRRQLETYLFVIDSNLAPCVGQQVTLVGEDPTAQARVDLLSTRAAASECDLTVKGVLGGEARGWYATADGRLQGDRAADAAIDPTVLHAAAAGAPLTYTCVPPGSGVRLGIDRDGDGVFDGDERDAGTDAADPDDPGCTGDCNGDHTVTVDELVAGVRIALSEQTADTCRPLDRRRTGTVTIAELIVAVNRALAGCPA